MHVRLDNGDLIFFLCDGKACGETCPRPETCSHTSDISHAKNFDFVVVNADNLTDYFELDEESRNKEVV